MTPTRGRGCPAVIAHRGWWWPDRSEENSRPSIAAALLAGYGVEIDLRRSLIAPDHSLLISHDVPVANRTYPAWAEVAPLLVRADPSLPVLIDIKEADTVGHLAASLRGHQLLGRTWLFDFELADADPEVARAVAAEVRCLARVSDKAGTGLAPTDPTCSAPWADGVWLDPWNDDEWVTAELITAWQARGPVFIAAPDLHQRTVDFQRLAAWRGADGICTDLVGLVAAWLERRPELFPTTIWWGE